MKKIKLTTMQLFVILLFCVSMTIQTPAAPGDLDPSFGNGGKVFTSIGKRDLYGSAVAVQADGKIVTAGSSKSVSSVDFALARFNADGSFDATFDGDGKVTTDFGGTDENVTAIAIQTDGKIVAVGSSYVSGQSLFVLARYNSDGSLDATFDGDGKVTTAIGWANAVALQADGKIVVAGSELNGSNSDFALARYNSNGSLDTTFDGDGIVYTDFNSTSDDAYAVAIQADGKIVAAGHSYVSGSYRFELARYNSDGSPDATFDGDGKVVTAPDGNSNRAYAVAIQADGKIVAAGVRGPQGYESDGFAIMRFNINGSLDTTFDGDGKVFFRFDSSPFSYVAAYAVAIQPDGRIVVAGVRDSDFALARLNSDGTLDTTFDGDGKVITVFNDGNYSGINDIALRADGRIIAVGGYNSTKLASYNSNGTLDTTFDGDGKLTIPTGNSHDVARDVAIQADGKIVTAGSADNRFALTRHNADGSLDTTFDGDGILTTAVSGYATSIAIQADGKLVAAGSAATNSTPNNSVFALARYNKDGSLDTTFDGDGKVTTDFSSSYNYARAVAIQADGKIVAAGYAVINSTRYKSVFALARFNNDGSLDTTFDGDGKVITDFGNYYEQAYALAIQADGKIVAAGEGGYCEVNDYGNYECGNTNIELARYNSDGSLDTTFDDDGKVTDDFDGRGGYAFGIAIKSNGRIVVAGTVYNSDYDFFLAQYQNNSKANFDFDGDGKSDISVFRPSDRTWYLNRSQAGFSATQFGLSTDKLTPADFDGDGKTDIAVYRDGTWYWLNSSNGNFNAVQFGLADDIPQPADFTGDGRAELTVYRSGAWWMLNLANNQVNTIRFGNSTDKPVAADYDGDGRADQAVYRGGEWHLNRSSQGYAVVPFGLSTDKAVPADYDGDGKTDLAVFRPSEGNWYVLQSVTNSSQIVNWGLASDALVPADYDGDGKTDIAVYRSGVWYIRQTNSGINYVSFGLGSDMPTNQTQ